MRLGSARSGDYCFGIFGFALLVAFLAIALRGVFSRLTIKMGSVLGFLIIPSVAHL
jgi:hypothetical protein